MSTTTTPVTATPSWLPARAPITSGAEYVESLRGRGLKVHFMGKMIAEPVDHPLIRPPINAVARTYDLANEDPALASAVIGASGQRVNRFLHVTESVADVVAQNKMQRRLGQLTGTCFQRCVGMDAINALYPVTWSIDQARGTRYHARLRAFIAGMQAHNLVIGGAMTDPKGDRSKGPSEQDDPDMFVRVVARRDGGVVIRGAKAHQTGCINSHWIVVMPTMRLGPADRDYAIVCAVPVDHPGLRFVVGRQSCDTRAMEGGSVDQGNAGFSGQEALILIDDVFVPEYRTHRAIDGFLCQNPGQAANDGPLYTLPWAQVFVRSVSTAAFGGAQAAINAGLAIMQDRVSTNTGKASKQDPMLQAALARAIAEKSEMETTLRLTFDELMGYAERGEAIPMQKRAFFAYQSSNVVRRLADLIDGIVQLLGGRAIYMTSEIIQPWLDLNAGRAHVANDPNNRAADVVGTWLGEQPAFTFL